MSARREAAAVKRRWFAVMGLLVLLGVGVLDVVLGAPVFSSAAGPLLVAASLLFVLGGLDPAPDRVRWYRFVGVGELLFGAVFVFFWVGPAIAGDRSTTALLLAAAGVANALLFAFVGVDWFLGGRYYDLSTFQPGPILGDGEDRG